MSAVAGPGNSDEPSDSSGTPGERQGSDALAPAPGERGPTVNPPETVASKRKPVGIKLRLFVAFCAMAAMTGAASIVAWYAFIGIDRAMNRIVADSVLGMAASLRLAEKSAEIAATAPALIASSTQESLVRAQDDLTQKVKELVGVIERLKDRGIEPEKIHKLTLIEEQLAAELHKLNAAVEQRLYYSEQRERAVSRLAKLHESYLDLLTPLVDDAVFALILDGEQVTADSTAAINGLIEGGVNTLSALLTLRAESNLAAGLLSEAGHMDDPQLIQPTRERFLTAATAVEKSLAQLPDSPEKDRMARASVALLELGTGADNVFTARQRELPAQAVARDELEAERARLAEAVSANHSGLLDLLTPLVDDAVFALILDGEQVTADSTAAINGLIEGGVNTLSALLTLRAESNLAAGLLSEAGHMDDPQLIQPTRERFLTAATAVEKSLAQLPDSPEKDRMARASVTLLELGTGVDNVFTARQRELQAQAVARDELEAERARLAEAVSANHSVLLDLLTPLVDDAVFALILDGEQVTADSTAAINGLIEGGVNTLSALLTLRAESNLAAGLLNEAANVIDMRLLSPLKERLTAAAARVEKTLAEIATDLDSAQLADMTQELLALGSADENVFFLREEELRQIDLARESLEANRGLALTLGNEVAELVTSAQASSDAAAMRSTHAIAQGKLLLMAITAISIVGATLMVAYYVVPRVITPLDNIRQSMIKLAEGDTATDIPYRDRNDEIGRMASALAVFRDITIEIQQSNLREIRGARQRLEDAIESITEGFALYDREDRLVISNSQYRTLLYPDMADEIVPGSTFESIIRKACERGYIKDAKGRVDEWVAQRLQQHDEAGESHLQQRGDGRWLMVSERKTRDGGTVAVYSDITELKSREKELAEKSSALEILSKQLAKYLSPQVYESIFSGAQEVRIASKRKKLSIFFSDIAGFTETTDKLESEELTDLLNHYLTEMSKIALAHGATIDKYVGDAIVIFFGDPESRGVKEDALACVTMAMAMQKRMRELQSLWRGAGIEKPLECRIGINTGYCTVGNFGSEDRMDYTLIGGGVNLASRLETAAKPGEILLSYETYAHVKDTICCESEGEITVKGIAYPVATYRVIDAYENLSAQRRVIHEDQAGLKIDIDVDGMSDQERLRAESVLVRALEYLKNPAA